MTSHLTKMATAEQKTVFKKVGNIPMREVNPNFILFFCFKSLVSFMLAFIFKVLNILLSGAQLIPTMRLLYAQKVSENVRQRLQTFLKCTKHQTCWEKSNPPTSALGRHLKFLHNDVRKHQTTSSSTLNCIREFCKLKNHGLYIISQTISSFLAEIVINKL